MHLGAMSDLDLAVVACSSAVVFGGEIHKACGSPKVYEYPQGMWHLGCE